MARFTLRELESITRDKSFSAAQRKSVVRYLKSPEAMARRARGRKMVMTRRRNAISPWGARINMRW